MNRAILRDAVGALEELANDSHGVDASQNAVKQFNSLLLAAKELYPKRADIRGMDIFYTLSSAVANYWSKDSVVRLRKAIELRPITSSGEILDEVIIDAELADDLKNDIDELRGALENELHKTSMLLCGAMAEAILFHALGGPCEKSPGLISLINIGKSKRVFGRDTRRRLDNLVDYRDRLLRERTLFRPPLATRVQCPSVWRLIRRSTRSWRGRSGRGSG